MKTMPKTKNSQPTENMKKLLEKYGKWEDGMSYEEASEAIDNLPKPKYPKAGLRLAKVVEINESDKTDKDGFKSFEIVFAIKPSIVHEGNESLKISDIFFYNHTGDENKECRSEWKLRAFKAALGYGADQQPMVKDIIGKRLWLGIGEVRYVDSNGFPVKRNDGSQKVFIECIGKYRTYKKGENKPIMAGDQFINGEEEDLVPLDKPFYREVVDRNVNTSSTENEKEDWEINDINFQEEEREFDVGKENDQNAIKDNSENDEW